MVTLVPGIAGAKTGPGNCGKAVPLPPFPGPPPVPLPPEPPPPPPGFSGLLFPPVPPVLP